MKVLVVLGHPRPASFGSAIFDAFCAGLDDAGVSYRTLSVSALDFDPDVRDANPAEQSLEPDLQQAQQDIAWADHLVFIYPTWWGTLPARLKGLLDRVLTPGFAFAYRPGGSGWDALLAGKTAELVTTMDTPGPVYRWIYGAPGHRAMARATLGFCGVKTVHTTRFGPMHGSGDAQRYTWLQQIRKRARCLATGPRTPVRHLGFKLGFKLGAWLRALRLQFYPMTWIAYAVGSLLAVSSGMNVSLFWIGYLALFALEAATVFSNEYFDLESDRNNDHPGPFNGGSRVLVDGSLSLGEMRAGFGVAMAVFIAASGWLLATPTTGADSFAVLTILTLMTLGYTVPPLKFSYRGLGE
ncbi:MAG: NAD(P)H-dependent oxidoreductase, partial [Gammaproteobacteria bacterium]